MLSTEESEIVTQDHTTCKTCLKDKIENERYILKS